MFVHGLQGHPRKSWTRKVAVSPSIEAPGSIKVQESKRYSFSRKIRPNKKEPHRAEVVFWLADLLPADCPNARILTWGYDSNVSNFLSAANKNNFFKHGNDLLYALSRERSGIVR